MPFRPFYPIGPEFRPFYPIGLEFSRRWSHATVIERSLMSADESLGSDAPWLLKIGTQFALA
jgi:hypothetical protein